MSEFSKAVGSTHGNEDADTISVAYWQIKGLGAPLRMMVCYAGKKLRAVCYPLFPTEDGAGIDYRNSGWMLDEKPDLRAKHPLTNLPWIQMAGRADEGEEDVVFVTQSNACLSYLGRRLGLLGKNDAERTKCEELLCELMDIRNGMVRFAYPSTASKDTAEALMCQMGGVHGSFGKIEAHLALRPEAPYLVGDSPTAPDFHLWEMLDQYHTMCQFFDTGHHVDPVHGSSSHGYLRAFYHNFRSLPQLERYFDSTLHALPFNNKGAHFGGHPTGRRWAMELDGLMHIDTVQYI